MLMPPAYVGWLPDFLEDSIGQTETRLKSHRAPRPRSDGRAKAASAIGIGDRGAAMTSAEAAAAVTPRFASRRQVCPFCVDKVDYIDYKQSDM